MSRLKFFLIIILMVLLVCLISYFYIDCNFGVKSVDAEINQITIDNSLNNKRNNYNCRLWQIEDRLYYDYWNGVFSQGAYEITNDARKRVYFDAPGISPSPIGVSYTYKGYFLKSFFHNNYIQRYNFDTEEFVDYIKIPNISEAAYLVSDGEIYVKDETESKYYHYKNGNYEIVASPETCPHHIIRRETPYYEDYFNGKYMYYIEDDFKTLSKYNLKTKSVEHSVKIDVSFENIISAFEDIVYYKYDNHIYSLDFLTEKNILIEKNAVFCNGIKDRLYYTVEENEKRNGLYCYTPERNSKRISSGSFHDIYLFDDKYVYYTDERKNLYRITSDGARTEKIFYSLFAF